MKLSTQWFQGVRPERREQHEASIRTSTYGFQHLLNIINQKRLEIDRFEKSLAQYEVASWSHQQAHLNGKKAALGELADLLAFINVPLTKED